ncbi:MAG: tyrosine-type recombinase/integrase [Solirubrobacteraceae bacterium]|nr:tyrosine-type recombinase/integrase [Solirubrobacteraceae bacterium]
MQGILLSATESAPTRGTRRVPPHGWTRSRRRTVLRGAGCRLRRVGAGVRGARAPTPLGRRSGQGGRRRRAPPLPVGPLFCIATGPTRGRAWSQAAAREQLRHTAALAGVRRRFAPHQLRHAHAVEMAREGVPLMVIQPQLGHTNLGITSIYLQGIDSAEIIDTVHVRRAPVAPVNSTLRP